MATVIERRGLDRWIVSLFQAGKTTREIEEIINKSLSDDQEPISQPTIARFLKPFRESLNEEKRQLVNKTFHEDLATLNFLISKNAAIARGIDWNERENCPMLNPDGTYRRRTYKPGEQIQASRVAISAIMEKFKHLEPEQKKFYEDEQPGPSGDTSSGSEMSEEQLDARITQLLKRVNIGAENSAAA